MLCFCHFNHCVISSYIPVFVNKKTRFLKITFLVNKIINLINLVINTSAGIKNVFNGIFFVFKNTVQEHWYIENSLKIS